MKTNLERAVFLCLLALLLGVSCLYYTGHFTSGRRTPILDKHLGTIERLATDNDVKREIVGFPPHFGSFVLAAGVHKATSLSVANSTTLVLCFHIGLTFWALAYVLSRLREEPTSWVAFSLLALALMLVAPIGLPGLRRPQFDFLWVDRSLILWRNISHTVVQPYVILAFGFFGLAIRAWRRDAAIPRSLAFLSMIMLLLSAIVKPNFAIAFLPALAVYALLMHRSEPRFLVKLALLVLPTCLMLVFQYYIGFVENPRGVGELSISVAPFEVFKETRKGLITFVLATAFPAFVFLRRWRHLTFLHGIAALTFAIALASYALFKVGDRDFEWGYWYGLQLLFLTAVLEWMRWLREERAQPSPPRLTLPAVHLASLLFLLHAFFGYARLVLVTLV